ncbi:MAG: bifunctional adenosylcobinamide kinase/adenosylcobinamide-phosphate guanylyltransferase [Sphaerochaetaceae bacterium]
MENVGIKSVSLVIGGARSGKSSFAEQLTLTKSPDSFYLATAVAFDEEMSKRIALHQQQRKNRFKKTIEEPINLAVALRENEQKCGAVLIDCTTVWLGNLLYNYGVKESYSEVEEFLQYLENPRCHIVIVSNEVGQGIVPSDYESRFFRDQNGFLNQKLAKLADSVTYMVGGIPIEIKRS